ncbi:MAG: hypothetical protein Q8R00_03705 [Candidatus Nanoarchaeia archaeon]|nr:hypothetical protein [Candidatus Nanoarchaeia archaeon]
MKRGWIYLLFLVLLIGSVSAEYYPYEYEQYPQPQYKPWYYGGFGSGFDFESIYDKYHLFIDAIIFGFIFFGLGSMVFKEESHKPLYIGIGLFMTASLLLFEARQNFKLLDIAGPWAVTVLIILCGLLVFRIVKDNLVKSNLIAGSLAAISVIWLANMLSSYFGNVGFISDLLNRFTQSDFMGGVFIIAIVALIIGGIKKFGLKGSK